MGRERERKTVNQRVWDKDTYPSGQGPSLTTSLNLITSPTPNSHSGVRASPYEFGDTNIPPIIHDKRDFPGGPGVKTLPSNAGDPGSISGWGTKVPHAAGTKPITTTTEAPTRGHKGLMQPRINKPKTTTKARNKQCVHGGSCALITGSWWVEPGWGQTGVLSRLRSKCMVTWGEKGLQ